MKTSHILLPCLLLCCAAFADDQTREAQRLLKEQGFYFGDITGEMNDETRGAIRRFQLHGGLEATDKLDAQTMDALQAGGEDTQPAQPAQPDSAAPIPGLTPESPSAPLKKFQPSPTPSAQESDRDFLEKDRRSEPAPAPAATEMAVLFRKTPYERAPRAVQTTTVGRVQSRLRKHGTYRGELDGIPGPEFQRALRLFQVDENLPVTGRLDMATLDYLKMLPGQKYSAFHMTGERALRGIRVW